MNVRVRLFAVLRERAGSDSLAIELAEDATVGDALAALAAAPPLAETLERMPVRMAVNRAYAGPETPLAADDELALIPPISGGAEPPARHRSAAAGSPRGGAEPHVRVTEEDLSLEALARLVGRPEAGAVVTFQGVTREVARLEYEAYREMAERRIAEILRDCIVRHRLEAAAAEHRLGAVALGEPSVIVAVSAAHRGEAFAGAREAIDRIKAEAPIWKREVERDGERRWVEGAAPPLDPGAREMSQ
ncbi:MAG TPA: molybdenum cofactor biosynthesis protein MoaE [Solirubrobacterales bacterium]|nr:molybdenum cofactor biosynthesis protein MoaE [Solirubrobacterales bacterium]